MKTASYSLAVFNLYCAASAALRGHEPRQLRPKATKIDIGATSPDYEPVFLQADDTKDSRRVPDNAPSNANREAYADLMNKQDVQPVEFTPSFAGGDLFVSSEESETVSRVKGASLLEMDGIDSVVILPEEMEDCDPDMEEMALDSSMCKEVFDTTTEGGGVAFESALGVKRDDVVPEEEQYGEEYYIQELHSLTGTAFDDETLFMKDSDLDSADEDGRSGRRLNINTRNIGIFKPLQCNSAGLPTAAKCEASPDGLMSTLVAAAGSGKVVIPCGKCIKVSN